MSYNREREQDEAGTRFGGPVKLAVIGVMLSAIGAYLLWGIGGSLLACGAILLLGAGALLVARLAAGALRETLARRPTNRQH